MIAENLEFVRRRIAERCRKTGRSADSVKLVVVTKEAASGEIEEVLGLGVSMLGENRVKDAGAKYRAIGAQAQWHLIGHLQTNKVKEALGIFSLIHSVDGARLACEINRQAARIGKVQDILIQVNTSGEKTKFGIGPGALPDLLSELSQYKNIRPLGLMTMAPEAANPESARPYFRALRELRDRVNTLYTAHYALHILSMGMSDDFEVAIEEGSNMVRIGRAIFGRERRK